jgi:phospholipase C
MPTRREFFRAAAALTGTAFPQHLIAAIDRAAAVEPEPGSSVLDAEHVVVLMQENRSFDHLYGSLRGVRGFNDPRVVTLPDGNPVWVQSDTAGKKHVPFRLDLKETKITWMGSLQHSWTDQVDAGHGGRHDRWLTAKQSGHKEYAAIPLTLGYHTRDDVPFYYALADAFTTCDQHFCSSLTGTTPNRLHLWTGTIREKPSADSPAMVRNEDVDYGRLASWTTFPERLESHGVSWKVYQNELSLASGLEGEADAWLANFTDNPLEWFTQYRVRFHPPHRKYLAKRVETLTAELETANRENQSAKVAELTAALRGAKKERDEWFKENFDKMTPREKRLHERAFSTNTGDPAYRSLTNLTYRDGTENRTVAVPKGDVLHQFRNDVESGTLPTVSWIVAPERFSDHPGSAWYGAWYLAEVLDILTKNPAVWKKTVFLLTYDENDGLFDHVPPYAPPIPNRTDAGKVSAGIDPAVEYVTLAQDRKRKPAAEAREGPIGLGYRVPLVIASPWSRGGWVNSQVCDHTSVLQFLERLVSHKTGRKLEEPNISRWRRTVCGDLLSVFQPAPVEGEAPGKFVGRDAYVEQIHRARFKPVPTSPAALTADDIDKIRRSPATSRLPRQEPGTRPSCALPYQLVVDGSLDPTKSKFVVRFAAKNEQFGDRSAGAPFTAYAVTSTGWTVRHYAIRPGDVVEDEWPLSTFDAGRYRIEVHGPNGFYREFAGGAGDPAVDVAVEPRPAGELLVDVTNRGPAVTVFVRDRSYGGPDVRRTLPTDGRVVFGVDASLSSGWYDVAVELDGRSDFVRRYAGRVETGRPSTSDPAMADGSKKLPTPTGTNARSLT